MESQPPAGKVADSVISLPHDLRRTLGSLRMELGLYRSEDELNVTRHMAVLENARVTLAPQSSHASPYLCWFPSSSRVVLTSLLV